VFSITNLGQWELFQAFVVSRAGVQHWKVNQGHLHLIAFSVTTATVIFYQVLEKPLAVPGRLAFEEWLLLRVLYKRFSATWLLPAVGINPGALNQLLAGEG
jgi:hypothetical protein